MYCTNCGAPLKETDVKCPYCGMLNPVGAEADYMDKLEDLREDVEDLEELPESTYVHNLKRHGGMALRTSLIVIAVCLVLFAGFHLISYFDDQQYRSEQRAELAFREKYFPILDELHAKGDDTAVWEYMGTLYEEDGSGALFSWEHDSYYYYYSLFLSVSAVREDFQKGLCDESTLLDGFYSSMQLLYPDSYIDDKLSSEDSEKVKEFIPEGKAFLMEDLHLTETEISQAYEECCEEDFLDFLLCEKYVKNNLQEFISEK